MHAYRCMIMTIEKTIQAIRVMPFALMMACIGAIIGLIVGVFYALFFGAIFSLIPNAPQNGINMNLLRVIFGAGAVVIMPIFGFIGGLIQGFLYAFLYNILAPRIGGIRLSFKGEPEHQQ